MKEKPQKGALMTLRSSLMLDLFCYLYLVIPLLAAQMTSSLLSAKGIDIKLCPMNLIVLQEAGSLEPHGVLLIQGASHTDSHSLHGADLCS